MGKNCMQQDVQVSYDKEHQKSRECKYSLEDTSTGTMHNAYEQHSRVADLA